MQAYPEIPFHGELDVTASNAAQQRGSHGLFRYFGKLAPDVTTAVLDEVASLSRARNLTVVDPMCGSGTTLLEAVERGWSARGFDINPVAILYARVKTRAVQEERVERHLDYLIETDWLPTTAEIDSVFASTRNAERWFSDDARQSISRLRILIDRLDEGRERDLLLAALLGRLRHYSNASVRTGRIFYDPESAVEEVEADYARTVRSILERVPACDIECTIEQADARDTALPAGSIDAVFCHPPYFGLYRFSADVLRFELEIGGWSRTAIARSEVAEGWKSGDVGLLEAHVRDMGSVMREAHRVLRDGGIFTLVTSNSTLGDVQLPVIDRLAAAAADEGLALERHLARKARHGSASYHRSARTDKVIQRDHVLLFRAQ